LENGLVNLVNTLDAEQFDHSIVCLTRAGSFADRISNGNVAIIEVGAADNSFRFPLVKLARLFRAQASDVVHTRGWGAVDAVFAARYAGVRTIIHGEHGREWTDTQGSNWKRNKIRMIVGRLVRHYVIVSDFFRPWLTKECRVDSDKIVYIPNGVDARRFHPLTQTEGADDTPAGESSHVAVQDLRRRLGVPEEGLLIGNVGRLDPVKDIPTLLGALAGVLPQYPNSRLAIVGDGPSREALQRQSRDLKIDHAVIWLGRRDDVPALLRCFDVFVQSSLFEGMSNTILEAMATGLPIIASETGGNAELVAPGVNGLLFPVGDVSALANALRLYLSDSTLRKAHALESRRRVLKQFEIGQMTQRYMDLYLKSAQSLSSNGAV
jgi:sugar transferase (PEP-CTERM/EpsH1 system associated)